MTTKSASSGTSKKSLFGHKNPLETLKDLGSQTARSAGSDLGKVGSGLLDQFFGADDFVDEGFEADPFARAQAQQEQKPQRKKDTLFNFREHYEKENVSQQIQELVSEIRSMTTAASKEGAALVEEMKEAEKLGIEALPPTPGVYHVRFLEQLLSLISAIRAKIGESRTWLDAMISKKKKRGSLFASRSKSMGTQYSLSQELSNSRSVQ